MPVPWLNDAGRSVIHRTGTNIQVDANGSCDLSCASVIGYLGISERALIKPCVNDGSGFKWPSPSMVFR